MRHGFTLQIADSLKSKGLISFMVNDPDKSKYGGIVFDIKRRYLVIRELRELEFDGVLILLKNSIRKHRLESHHTCADKIIRENGQLQKASIPDWLFECSSIREILEQLKQRDIWPGIELKSKKSCALFIGPILKTRRSGFQMQSYNANGVWEGVYEFEIDSVLTINFEDGYTREFNRYMRKHETISMMEMRRVLEDGKRKSEPKAGKQSRREEGLSTKKKLKT